MSKEETQTKPLTRWRYSLKSKFTYNLDDAPKEIYNWKLFMSVFVFGILGCARGFDEGCIAGTVAQNSFVLEFGLKDPSKSASQLANLKSNITAMVQLGSIGGSLLSIYLVDRWGRIRTLQFGCLCWIVAAIIQITSHSVGQLYAGRLLEGIFGIGPSVVCGPIYLSEVAPKSIRGLCNCIFAGAVYFGIMLAYFAHYGTALHISNSDRNQWVVPTALKIVLAGLIFGLSLIFCIESPRWLIKKGKTDQAVTNFSKIRNLPPDHPYILSELSDVNEQLMIEEEAVHSRSWFSAFTELFTIKSIRYRMFVCLMNQILGQWSGSNAITIYAPELFAMAGQTKQTDKMMMTAVLGVVKFVSAYLTAFFFIDLLGRRTCLYLGISIQAVTTLYFAIFLQTVPEAANSGVTLTGDKHRAATGALAAIFLSGAGWTIGWNTIQYLFNAEVLPLRVRNLGTALIMAFHFANQYGNSKAMTSLLLAMHNFGAFYFFCGVCLLGLLFAWFFIPEVAGRSLESMDELFNLPWYLIGRRGAQLCPDSSEVGRVKDNHQANGDSYGGNIDVYMKPRDERAGNASLEKESAEQIR